MILPSFFTFTYFDCFACTLPVYFAVLGDPVHPVPYSYRVPQNLFRLRIYEASTP